MAAWGRRDKEVRKEMLTGKEVLRGDVLTDRKRGEERGRGRGRGSRTEEAKAGGKGVRD